MTWIDENKEIFNKIPYLEISVNESNGTEILEHKIVLQKMFPSPNIEQVLHSYLHQMI